MSIIYITTFITALITSLATAPLVIKYANKKGIIDKPGGRKVHDKPTPLWGGLAVFAGFIIGTACALLMFKEIKPLLSERAISMLSGLIISSIIIVILGMFDDVYALSARYKLVVQILAASILYYCGISITFFKIPGDGYFYIKPIISFFITVFWIVGITNAINLLDGLDGLLSGVGVISGLLFFAVAIIKGHVLVAILLMAVVGGCLGFLKYNFNPAKIFLGDTGSLFIGLIFASISIIGAIKTTATLSLLIPILIMWVPIFDTSFAIIRRFVKGVPIFSPDKEHVHHKLLRTGISQRRAVLVIYAINLAIGLGGLLIAWMYK